MKVKTLRPHANGYGLTHHKKKGYSYEHPEPQALIAQGIVEPYDERKIRGRKGAGKAASKAENGDS